MFSILENKLYKRVRDLYIYFKYCEFKEPDSRVLYPMDIYERDIRIEFYIYENPMLIEITDFRLGEYMLRCGTPITEKDEYTTLSKTHYEELFQIDVTPHFFNIYPSLTLEKGAEYIDNTLKVLETYLLEKYGPTKNILNKVKEEKRAEKIRKKKEEQIHKQQLKLLK